MYDSNRKTTPLLDKRNDLFVFNNVVSPYSNTINSVLSTLSISNLENKIPFNKGIDIIDVFHSAGFKTYWISNQSPIGIWENLVTVFANKSDQATFVNISSNSSFEATLNTSYDSKLFTPFTNVLKEKNKKKFIVLHLMGSHSSYAKRYPTEFDKFRSDNSKEQTIAEYDNSILYSDYIINKLISLLSENKQLISSTIYISDHGENVYDELDNVGHDYTHKLPNSNVEIPFILWLSPEFKKTYANKITAIKNNLDAPFVSDDLFHSIIDLNNINTPFLEKQRSLVNENYNILRPRILEDGKLYQQ